MQNSKNLPILFIAKFFSSLTFGTLLSSLVIYLSSFQHLDEKLSVETVGMFLALNYVLPLISGYVGNQYICFKKLYCSGLLIQAVGLVLLSSNLANFLSVVLAMILMGGMVGTVGILVFINTTVGDDENLKRRAILWNYVAMNLGFLLAYFISGLLSSLISFNYIFLLISIFPLINTLLISKFIKYQTKKEVSRPWIFLVTLFINSIIFVTLIIQYRIISRLILLLLPIGGLFFLSYLAIFKFKNSERYKLFLFIFFMTISIFFWSIYMLLPTLLMLFIKDNIFISIDGLKFAPQWFDIVDASVLVLTLPLLSKVISLLKEKYEIEFPTWSFFFVGVTFLGMGSIVIFGSIGDYSLLTASSTVLLTLLALYITLQSLGELFIGPEGYGLPVKFTPVKIRGFATGAWISTLGVASLISSIISDHVIGNSKTVTRISILHAFHHIFFTIIIVLFIITFVGITFDRKKLANIPVKL